MTLDWTTSYVFNTPWAVRSLELLFVVSAGIQTLEYWRMRSGMQGDGLWVWSIQRQDIPTPWMLHFLDALFVPNSFSALLILRLIALISMTAHGSNLLNIGFLFISNLAILIRWRGAFNGGSDFMTVVALTGLVVANVAALFVGPVLAWKAGLWYITIHAMSSYFISGAIKVFSPAWRDGSALSFFLDGGLYGPLSERSVFRKPLVAAACAWGFILWECCFPLTMAGPAWAVMGCGIAAVFHFLVFRFFGLNRFFWAWIVNFPAIVYCSAQW